MKTKQITKERKQEREFEVANNDIKWEYENLISDDILDEVALCECLMEEDE